LEYFSTFFNFNLRVKKESGNIVRESVKKRLKNISAVTHTIFSGLYCINLIQKTNP